MYKKQHQRGFLFSSHLVRGKRIQEAVEGCKDRVPIASLWRLDQKIIHHAAVIKLWTPNGDD